MSDKERIKALAREAEIYRSQGLLSGAKQKYQEILQFVQNHEQYSKDKKLVDAVNKKIRAIEENLSEVLEAPERPEVTEDVQNIIQKLFSFCMLNIDAWFSDTYTQHSRYSRHKKQEVE